jgi:hypothetical protein
MKAPSKKVWLAYATAADIAASRRPNLNWSQYSPDRQDVRFSTNDKNVKKYSVGGFFEP